MKHQKNSPDIFGMAINNYFDSADEEDIIVHSPDFDDDVIPVSYLFRNFSEMPALERKALEMCSGRVLDVGCGAGSHALYLQNERKLEIMAIDTSEGACKIAEKRGVRNAENIAFEDLSKEKFDTILMLMNGIGIVGKLQNLDKFFEKLRQLLNENGQVLLDSSDLIYLFDAEEDGGIWVDAADGYYGELKYSLSYKEKSSKLFDWLYLDFDSLSLAASKNRFSCELVQKGNHYDYLAKLTLNS